MCKGSGGRGSTSIPSGAGSSQRLKGPWGTRARGFTAYTISEVVGHKVQGMTFGTYKGAALDDQRRACVEAVRLPKP